MAGSKSVSARPSDADAMTNAALEATISSSGKKLETLRQILDKIELNLQTASGGRPRLRLSILESILVMFRYRY